MTAKPPASPFPVPLPVDGPPEPTVPTLADLAAVWPKLDDAVKWMLFLRARALAGRAFNMPPERLSLQ